MKRGRGQSAIEFVIIIGAVLFFFVAFFSVIQINSDKRNMEKEEISVREFALSIQNEINLAAESSEGYIRTFQIGDNIFGKEYELKVQDNFVYVRTKNVAMAYPVLNFSGEVKKGQNIIEKKNGTIYIHQ